MSEISIGSILIAIIVPGLILAVCYAIYIIVRCQLQPSVAPAYAVADVSLFEKLSAFARYILPIGLVIFLVIGVMLMGIATPSEAAATGALSVFLLAAFYGRLNWDVVKKSVASSLKITVMLFIIIAAARTFSQILAFTGATQALSRFVVGLPVPPIFIVFAMQIALIFLGMFMDQNSIIMITVPIFVPIINILGFSPVWFAALFLLNMEMGGISPPFGLTLFAMKAVAPPGTTMGDIYRAGLPFFFCGFVVLMLMLALPPLSLWLPAQIR